MSVAAWRAILLALCVGAAVVNAVGFFGDGIEASSALGFQASRTDDSAIVRVDAVDAGGAAEASGLRRGDLIDVRDLVAGERYRLLTGVYPHEKSRLTFRAETKRYRSTTSQGINRSGVSTFCWRASPRLSAGGVRIYPRHLS